MNQAIVQFDSVVQNNASSSEQTASAAEELQAQVHTLEAVVRQLHLLVSGKQFTAPASKAFPVVTKPRALAAGQHHQKISFEHDEEFTSP